MLVEELPTGKGIPGVAPSSYNICSQAACAVNVFFGSNMCRCAGVQFVLGCRLVRACSIQEVKGLMFPPPALQQAVQELQDKVGTDTLLSMLVADKARRLLCNPC